MNTDIELVDELTARNEGGRYDILIANAKSGMYHDYRSMIAMPKMSLAKELSQFPELADLREAVINGKFDEDFPKKGYDEEN
jgi:hypothetical protein